MRKNNKIPHKLWSAFSVYTNGMKLFDITKLKSPSAINSMNGVRAMSIFWIIIGHRFYNQIYWGNVTDPIEYLQKYISTWISLHPIAVDTFFVLGALLMTWGTLRDCEKGELNIGRMIWRRYLRYTPALAAMILFVFSLAKFFATGPFDVMESLIGPCRNSWWVALLHVQNYLPWENLCLNHTWYLSVDFQLFIISPFIIWFIHKFGRKMLVLPGILLMVTIIYTISISAVLGIKMPHTSIDPEFMNRVYSATQSRAGPWFIGMIFGYFMYHQRGKTFKINWALNALLWILAFSNLIIIMLISHEFTITEITSQAANSTFMAFQRNLWAVSICWIIFACQHLKTGGIVRWFLSLPHWQPFARMGLSMYILHILYQIISMSNHRSPLFFNFWEFVSFQKYLIISLS